MSLIKKFCAIFVIVCVYSAIFAGNENVFVLANKNVKESCELAKSYCALREIPEENIILLDVKNTANISRKDYEDKVAKVVFNFIRERKLFGSSSEYPSTAIANRAKYLVLCKGLPFRILEETLDAQAKPTQMHNNSACLDSEIALVLTGKYEIMDFQKNMSFQVGTYSTYLNQLIVARLDGITYADALNLVKSALVAEKFGLRGRAYVDKSKKYPAGDKWLDGTATILSELGFDLTLDEVPACMNYFTRFDAVAFYFGWYASNPTAYFKHGDFKFASGASAYHIYSFSASNLSHIKTWVPNMVSHAPAATFGYTDEPFLHAVHRPDIYMLNLAKGFSAGESAFLAMPVFSWKGMFVGDPLFQPFKISLDAQIENIKGGCIDELSQYSVIRKMNLIAKEFGGQKAFDFGRAYLPKLEVNFALKWKMSQLAMSLENKESAVLYAKSSLQDIKNLQSKNFGDTGLLLEILEFLRTENPDENYSADYTNIVRVNIEKNEEFLKAILPSLLKKKVFSARDAAEFAELNLKLNPPKPKTEQSGKK